MKLGTYKTPIFPIIIGSMIILIFLLGAIESGISNTESVDVSSINRKGFSLENLYPGSSFSKTHDFILNIPENEVGGMNLTQFYIISVWHESYLAEIFYSFNLDMSLEEKSFEFKMISLSKLESITQNGWEYEKFDPLNNHTWFYLSNWEPEFLESGSYQISLRTYGKTTAPETCKFGRFFCDNVTLNFWFGLQLS